MQPQSPAQRASVLRQSQPTDVRSSFCCCPCPQTNPSQSSDRGTSGGFLPHFAWVAFGLSGIEPSQGPAFFDDWSHSLAHGRALGCAVFGPILAQRAAADAGGRQGRRIAFLAQSADSPKNLVLFPLCVLSPGIEFGGHSGNASSGLAQPGIAGWNCSRRLFSPRFI